MPKQSADAVRKVQRRCLHDGDVPFKGPGRRGRHHQHLTKSEEREFLVGLLEETRPNAILDARFVQQAYEKRVGHPLADTAIYRLLRRWGWRREATGKVMVPRWGRLCSRKAGDRQRVGLKHGWKLICNPLKATPKAAGEWAQVGL